MIKTRLIWWLLGLVNGLAFVPLVAFARGIDMSKAGCTLWIFLAVGAGIVLLQAIPAVILVMGYLLACRRESK